MGKFNLKYLLLVSLFIVFISCLRYNNKLSTSFCLKSNNTEKCFFKLYSVNGPIKKASDRNDNALMQKLISVENNNELNILCNKLEIPSKNQIYKTLLLKTASINGAPCICDYCNKQTSALGDIKDLCEKLLHDLNCKKDK